MVSGLGVEAVGCRDLYSSKGGLSLGISRSCF